MAHLEERLWTSAFTGLTRRDRRPCRYSVYRPDHLAGRHFVLDGDVAADVADAEAELIRLNVAADALANTEALARLLLRAEVVMPYALPVSDQGVMQAYRDQPDSRFHPDKVLLAACSHGYGLALRGVVMGPLDTQHRDEILVKGVNVKRMPAGACFAITAKYSGQEKACREYVRGVCSIGSGQDVEVLLFTRDGEVTEISRADYRRMKGYAQATTYEVPSPRP